MAATTNTNTEPPALLREALERRRAAGLPWHDRAYDHVVVELTPSKVNGSYYALWREILLSQRDQWRQAYERTGPATARSRSSWS